MRWLLIFMTFLSGCGGGGVDTLARERVTKAGGQFLEKQLAITGDPEQAYYNWTWFFTNIGLFLIFLAVVCFIWYSKTAALRLASNGLLFLVTAQAVEFLGDWCRWLALLGVIIYIVFNPSRAEKILARIGINVDLNRDGIIGTGKIKKTEANL